MARFDQLCGWHPINKWSPATHRSVEDWLSKLRHPVFELSHAYQAMKDTGVDQNVFLWKAEQKIFGRTLNAYLQTEGTCTSMGFGRSLQDQILIDIVLRGQEEELPDDLQKDWFVATEPIYAGSRVEIGGSRIGNGAGSIGAWCARWVIEKGILFRRKYGQHDLQTADDSIAVRWGRPNVGVPDVLETTATEHPANEVSLCTSYTAARDALANYNNVTVASGQGFTTVRVDGFCTPRGTWNHLMCFRGCFVGRGNRPGLVCQQSWGNNSPSGPRTLPLETGEVVEMPLGCFGVDAEVADRMLRQGDSHVVSGVNGFRIGPPDFLLI